MRFHDAYTELGNTRPVYSFEVFPPRTEKAEASFQKTLPEILALRPDFVTVTYGAMGSTRDRTLEIARTVKAVHGVESACHLTCVGSTSADIDDLVSRVDAAGIENFVALRGDPPEGDAEFRRVEGGYAHAIELVRHIRRRGAFGIAVAGYPEKHLEAPDLDTDIRFLKEKVDAGADLVITQLFYDNRHYFEFVERARAAGVACPIVPGLLPIVSEKQVRRLTEMCGASVPPPLLNDLAAAGDDSAAAREIGVRHTVEQVTELLAAGVPGIHFYVLNRSSLIRRIFDAVPPDRRP